jgi:F-type H+-transporting ATPase subunit delta
VAEANSTTKASVSGLSGRYATALFELARDGKALETVETGSRALNEALEKSSDLRSLIANPIINRSHAQEAIIAVAKALGLDQLTNRFLAVLAQNGRLSALPDVLSGFGQLLAAHRGESTAIVTSAHALSADQLAALTAKLKASLARDVAIQTKVDPGILGGLIVKVGSKLIDSSLKTKLDALASHMKA